MGVTVSTVLGYLYRQAGVGKIQRSDIILSINRETRDLIEAAIRAKKIHGSVEDQALGEKAGSKDSRNRVLSKIPVTAPIQ